jgi:[citrate (pro-3S)-lyase] ligase
MSINNFYYEYGAPFTGSLLKKVKVLLQESDLEYENGIDFSVAIFNFCGDIIGTGSLQGNILKCITVSQAYKGEGLSATIITHLITHAFQKGYKHLFLFTVPKNKGMFIDLGFYPIAETADVVLMENVRNGIQIFVQSLERPATKGIIGAVVANCNPFTNGHLYLIETASRCCDVLHVFILSEDKSAFPANIRYELAKEGLSHLSNVVLHQTSDYIISSLTFPSYFIKDKGKVGYINSTLDLTIFAEHFAKELNITKRFVGTEPYCQVTSWYNSQMKTILRDKGIDVIEIPRCKEMNEEISASKVRRLMAIGDYKTIMKLVPSSTYNFIISDKGKEIAIRLKKETQA